MISGDDSSSHRRSSVAISVPGRRDTVISNDGRENLAGRGVRRFQLHDPPPARSNGSTLHPPSSFHPDSRPGKKRRNSHDSAAAVRGSVNGDASPIDHENGGLQLHKDPSKESLHPEDEGVAEDGDLSMGMLLAQQQWADRRSSTALDTEIQTPTVTPIPQPGTKHTTIQFVEPSSTSRPRERGAGEVPPISYTPPVQSSRSSSPSPLTPEISGRRQTAVDQDGRNGSAMFSSSPLSLSPAQTPDLDSNMNADPVAALRPVYPQRRAATSIVRQILESTEEVAEPTDSETNQSSTSGRPSRAIASPNLARARSRSISPHQSQSQPRSRPSSRPGSPIPVLQSRPRTPATDVDRPTSITTTSRPISYIIWK